MGLVWVTTQVMRPDRPLQRGFPGIPKTRKGFVRSAGGCRDGRGARIPAHGCMRTRAAAHARVRPGVLYTATGPTTIVVVGPVGGGVGFGPGRRPPCRGQPCWSVCSRYCSCAALV